MKASNVVAPAKSVKQAPDLEEAFEDEDDGEVLAEPAEEEDDEALKKDKYIKQPKAKKVAAGKKKGSRGKVDDDDGDGDDGEEVKPKAAAKGRGRGKK